MRVLTIAAILLTCVSAAALADNPPLQAPSSPDTSAEETKPSDLLRVAQGALATGRRAQAQEALEMAQTRLLDRSVAIGRTGEASTDPAVLAISQALQALAGKDRASAMEAIQTALDTANAEGQ